MDEEQLRRMSETVADTFIDTNNLKRDMEILKSQFTSYIANHQTDAMIRFKTTQEKLDRIIDHFKNVDDRCADHEPLLAAIQLKLNEQTKAKDFWDSIGGKVIVVGATAMITAVVTILVK